MELSTPTVNEDAPCSCGRNLRGLSLNRHCPTCGRAVLDAVRFLLIARPEQQTAEERLWVAEHHRRMRRVADASGFDIEACWLVRYAMSYASKRWDEPPVPVTASRVCGALREYARRRFGGVPAGVRQLRELGIRSSEDVGKIVYTMVAAGLIQESANDSQNDFRGLFTLENLHAARLS